LLNGNKIPAFSVQMRQNAANSRSVTDNGDFVC
jgi:hypothetical protein